MFTVTHTITIHCPIEQVFAYMTNRTNLPQWFVGVHEVVQDELIQLGSRATITAKLVGITFSFTSEIIAYEPDHMFAIKIDKPFPLVEHETFTSQGSSTRFDYSGTLYPQGFLNIMTPLLRWLFIRQFTASFRNLKAVLESDGDPETQA